MKMTSAALLATCFAISFLAVGVPYWQVPYSKAELPTALGWLGVFFMLLLSALPLILRKSSFLKTVVVLGLVIPAVVTARVIVETSADPTSHNLWPLELVLAAFISFPIALFGALCGFVIASFCSKPTTRSGT